MLETYASNLLKVEQDRPANWRKIDFSHVKFQEKVGVLKGYQGILKKLGYEEEVYDANGTLVGQKFPDSVKNSNRIMVEKILTDLCIARYEIDKIATKSHPNWKMLLETRQIPSEYDVCDSSDSDFGQMEDEEERFVLASSPKTFHSEKVSKRVSIYEDEESEGQGVLRSSLEEESFTKFKAQNPAPVPGGQDMLYKQPTQGVSCEEYLPSSAVKQIATGAQTYSKTEQSSASKRQVQYMNQKPDFNGSDPCLPFSQPKQGSEFNRPDRLSPIGQSSHASGLNRPGHLSPVGQSNQASVFNRPDHLSQLGQLNQGPDFTRPSHISAFGQPNQTQNVKRPSELSSVDQPGQGLNFSGPDASSTFRQPRQTMEYNSTSSYWQQPVQMPHSGIGINQASSFVKPDDQQFGQSSPPNTNFYSSDTTWVYSSSVTTPMKSGPYPESVQDPVANPKATGNAGRRLPEIYSREEESTTLGAKSRIDYPTNAKKFRHKLPGIYSEVEPPHFSAAGLSPMREPYDVTRSSGASSQAGQPSRMPQPFRNVDYIDVNAPRIQYSSQSASIDHQTPDRNRQGYREGTGYSGPGRMELPKLYERDDEMINLSQSHYESQRVDHSQANAISSQQGTCLNSLYYHKLWTKTICCWSVLILVY